MICAGDGQLQELYHCFLFCFSHIFPSSIIFILFPIFQPRTYYYLILGWGWVQGERGAGVVMAKFCSLPARETE